MKIPCHCKPEDKTKGIIIHLHVSEEGKNLIERICNKLQIQPLELISECMQLCLEQHKKILDEDEEEQI